MLLNPGIASLSIIVSKTIYLAFDKGFTNEIKLDKPIQGTIIDHASTHRCRYTRSSIGSWLNKSSQSNFLGLSTNPSMVIDQDCFKGLSCLRYFYTIQIIKIVVGCGIEFVGQRSAKRVTLVARPIFLTCVLGG